MARSGVRLPILQRMMGHAFPETLQYVNISMADVEVEFHRAIRQLESRYAEAPVADENEDGDDQ